MPFSTFVANKKAHGQNASHSLVLRGYVRAWLGQIGEEYDRIRLIELLVGKAGGR